MSKMALLMDSHVMANQASMLDWFALRGRQVDGVFALEITDKESMFRCTYRLGCTDKALRS